MRRELLNNLISKPTIITSFSISPDKAQILEDFKKIARREAGPRGFSQVLLKALAEYNLKHGEGNPQLKISTYLSKVEKSPVSVICYSNLIGALSDGRILCRKYGWIQGIKCYPCKENMAMKKKL